MIISEDRNVKVTPHGEVVKELVERYKFRDDIDEGIIGEQGYDICKMEGFTGLAYCERCAPWNGCTNIYTVYPSSGSVKEEVERYFTSHGYFNGMGYDVIAGTDGEWIEGWWEKIYDEEATEKVLEAGKLWHICSTKDYEKIMEEGIKPQKSQWKRVDNPERCYFYNRELADSTVKGYILDFYRNKNNCGEEFTLLEIDVAKIGEGVKFYNDPRMRDSVYCYDIIPPEAIIKTVSTYTLR